MLFIFIVHLLSSDSSKVVGHQLLGNFTTQGTIYQHIKYTFNFYNYLFSSVKFPFSYSEGWGVPPWKAHSAMFFRKMGNQGLIQLIQLQVVSKMYVPKCGKTSIIRHWNTPLERPGCRLKLEAYVLAPNL